MIGLQVAGYDYVCVRYTTWGCVWAAIMTNLEMMKTLEEGDKVCKNRMQYLFRPYKAVSCRHPRSNHRWRKATSSAGDSTIYYTQECGNVHSVDLMVRIGGFVSL